MQRYIFIRFVQGIFTLFAVSVIVFVLSRVTGNPVDLLLPPQAPESQRQHIIEDLGLDRPLAQQYVAYMGNLFQGDFGVSVITRTSTSRLYLDHLPTTLRLTFGAVVFALLVTIPLGVAAALKRGTIVDHLARFLATIGLATPLFLIGLGAIQLFAVQAGWLPAGGTDGFNSNILPMITLGIVLVAGLSRVLRSSMLEVLDADYIRMLRLKGLPEWRVVLQHGLRNAMIAPVTVLGQYIAVLLAGATVVEVIFVWPGVGRLAFQAITARDYPLVQTVILINAALIVGVSLLIDVLYVYIDPRVRLQDS